MLQLEREQELRRANLLFNLLDEWFLSGYVHYPRGGRKATPARYRLPTSGQ